MNELCDYAKLLREKRCPGCEKPLSQSIQHYNNTGGWEVKGFQVRQWLYVNCPTCKYDWALWKLGIRGRVHESPSEKEAAVALH